MGVFSIMGEKIKIGLGNAKIGFSNIVKKPLRKAKIETHFRKAGGRRLVTYKKYEPMIEFLYGINDQLMEIEARFGEIEEKLISEVEDLYRFCGPYTDPKLIEFEQKYASKGTMYDIKCDPEYNPGCDPDIKPDERDFKKEKIKINGEDFTFDMPPAKTVYFEKDNRKEEVVYFGYDKVTFWERKFREFIYLVCDHAKKKIEGEVKDPKDKEDKLNYIGVVYQIYETKIKELFRERAASVGEESIGGNEKHFHTPYMRTIHDRLIADYSSLKASILKIVPQKVKYKHTYKIAVPVLRSYDGEVEKIQGREAKLENFGINPPVDERGMPWEVDNEGRIMIGPNRGKQVPKDMIRDEDLMKICMWVVNEFDSYRDDLRDGRYHQESLTVTDYLMANHYSAGREWENKDEKTLKTDKSNRNNDDRRYVMRLHDGRTIEGIRRPDNLNPAFDLRVFEEERNGVIGIPKAGMEWMHIGRKYYYDDCSEIAVEEQDTPVATTRGTAMYLIDKFLSEGMLIEEVHDDLMHIGVKSGFDYGPRKFGAPLCKDPFDIDLSSANISAKPYKKSH